MLTNVEIKNFKSCTNVRLDGLEDLLVLIGRNGAGKTNILKAIEWACQFASTDVETDNKRRANANTSGDVGLTFKILDASYRYEVRQKINYIIDEKRDPQAKVSLEEKLYLCEKYKNNVIVHRIDEHMQLFDLEAGLPQTVEVSATVPSLAAMIALFPEGSYFRRIAASVTNFLSAIQYYPLHNFDENLATPLIMGRDYQKWTNDRNEAPNSITSALYKVIDMHLNDLATFEELSDLMGMNGLGLLDKLKVTRVSISSDTSDKSLDSSVFLMSFIKNNNSFNFNDLSFGTKRILFLLIALLYDKSVVALLEQPEDGVHTGMVDKLLALFRSYAHRSQFVIASHSTTILNKSYPREIYFISNEDGTTQARPLTSEEIFAAERFLKKDGPLSEFLDLIGDD